jgi:general L-amino acid transport system permease protein
LGYFIVTNTLDNLERQNIASGWDFVETTAGFGIIQALASYSETSSYGQALFVGFLNTLLVAVVGIFFATIIGLSSAWRGCPTTG